MDNLEEDIPISPTRPKEAHPPPDFTPIPVPRPTFDDEDDRDPQESDDDDFVTVTGAGRGYKLPVIGRTIFFGKSSHVFFSRDAVQMRQTMTGIPEDEGPSLITEASRRPQFWKTPDVRAFCFDSPLVLILSVVDASDTSAQRERVPVPRA